jgi:hypothetical protein
MHFFFEFEFSVNTIWPEIEDRHFIDFLALKFISVSNRIWIIGKSVNEGAVSLTLQISL